MADIISTSFKGIVLLVSKRPCNGSSNSLFLSQTPHHVFETFEVDILSKCHKDENIIDQSAVYLSLQLLVHFIITRRLSLKTIHDVI